MADSVDSVSRVAQFVTNADVGAGEGRAWITPPEKDTVQAVDALRRKGMETHLPFLVEYGLTLHCANLEYSHLSRELPVAENILLAELVRLAAIPMYQAAHEAGWLENQFHGPFTRTGWSSYQIYVWAKERRVFAGWPNEARILALLDSIEASPARKLGGKNVCHYGCR